jgi:hypothetical protein
MPAQGVCGGHDCETCEVTPAGPAEGTGMAARVFRFTQG